MLGYTMVMNKYEEKQPLPGRSDVFLIFCSDILGVYLALQTKISNWLFLLCWQRKACSIRSRFCVSLKHDFACVQCTSGVVLCGSGGNPITLCTCFLIEAILAGNCSHLSITFGPNSTDNILAPWYKTSSGLTVGWETKPFFYIQVCSNVPGRENWSRLTFNRGESRILVRGPSRVLTPDRGPWAQNLLKIDIFPFQLPENCMILK